MQSAYDLERDRLHALADAAHGQHTDPADGGRYRWYMDPTQTEPLVHDNYTGCTRRVFVSA
jgi:hypothetical protein